MYLPVEFDLHDFQLGLGMKAAANFHKRMKELGFDVVQQGDTMIWGRGKSRITAFLNKDMSLNFLPDFFDDTPGGTVYAIFEKLCMNFGGTMVGQYKVPTTGQSWDIRISGGMNLSGRPDVGQREHVMEDSNATPSSSGNVPTANQQTAQASPQATASGQSTSGGQVPAGQQGELSARDKLYKVLVEEQYANYVKQNGEDPNVLIGLIKKFKEDYPEQTEEEKKQEAIINSATSLFNLTQEGLGKELKSLSSDDMDDIIVNVSDETGYDYEDVEQVFNEIITAHVSANVNASLQPFIGQPNNAATQAQMAQTASKAIPNPPAGWTFDTKDAQELIRLQAAYLYYSSLNPKTLVSDDLETTIDMQVVLGALMFEADGRDTVEIYQELAGRGRNLQDLKASIQDTTRELKAAKVRAGQ